MKPLFGVRPDGSHVAILPEPLPCGCGRAAIFVVNRRGKTRCLDCDARAGEGAR